MWFYLVEEPCGPPPFVKGFSGFHSQALELGVLCCEAELRPEEMVSEGKAAEIRRHQTSKLSARLSVKTTERPPC